MILQGDSLEVLKTLDANSVDSVVTDPPYGLSKEPDVAEVMQHWINGDAYSHKHKGFMGKSWDSFVPGPEYWREVFRVLKPGGHALVACGTRTQDLMTMALRFGGFEIRDVITWHYGSGFPKSMSVDKAIDKAAGAKREVVAANPNHRGQSQFENVYTKGLGQDGSITAPATLEAKQWQGFGTALKPATEFFTLARKPLEKKLTVAQNVLKWGVGGLNIDGTRVAAGDDLKPVFSGAKGKKQSEYGNGTVFGDSDKYESVVSPQGRWPANVILDEHAKGQEWSRYFYCAKASKAERNAGLEGMPFKEAGIKNDSGRGFSESDPHKKILMQNFHPTVKPIKLMSYLCRLVTPPGGTVLDPFAGSGTTGVAAKREGFKFIGIELDPEYHAIAERRLEAAL
jgi:DNA modification methylase